MTVRHRWYLWVIATLLVANTNARGAQEAPAVDDSAERPRAEQMGFVEVQNVDELDFWRHLSLMAQYALTPTRLAQRVAPLHAYSPDDLCDTDLKNIQTHAYRYGPAAVVEHQSGAWQANYYSDVRGAIRGLRRGLSDHDFCETSDGPYVATTFPIPSQRPHHQLLLMNAERFLPNWSHMRENVRRIPYQVEYSRDTSGFSAADNLVVGTTSVYLERSQQEVFKLSVEQQGEYRIDALATDVDPVLHLYIQSTGSDTAIPIESNDDFGGGLNARIETVLQPGSPYYVEVQEFYGEPGAVELNVRLLP